jgi:hypothetical protein
MQVRYAAVSVGKCETRSVLHGGDAPVFSTVSRRSVPLVRLGVLREFFSLAVDDFVGVRAFATNKTPQRSNKAA